MSHTPGPWYVTELEDGVHVDGAHEIRYDRNGKASHHVTVVADVHHGRDDARLIAAAPDLLAAVERFLEADKDREFADTVDLDEYAMQWANALNGLKAAVAKARGES